MKFNIDKFETIEDRAAYWFLLLESPDCTPKQRRRFEIWKRESQANEETFLKIQRGNAFVDRYIADPVLAQIGQQALEQTESKSQENFWVRVSAVAATLIMVFGVMFLTLNQDIPNNRDKIEISMSSIYETQTGERSTVTLSDGSVVTLNTNSRIEVNFTAMRRGIKLVKGQGFFDVSKDVNRPFSVEAGEKRIVALGTEFDVRYDNNKDVEVTLIEGRVVVDDIAKQLIETSSSTTNSIEANQVVELVPGERLIARVEEQPQVITIKNIGETTSWRDGRLIYRAEPIENVIKEINRYSLQKIKLSDDSRIREIKISGVFNTGRASTFVDTLERMHPLNARRSSENQLTIVWQE